MTVALPTRQQFVDAVDVASRVTLSAYELSTRGKVTAALERAADRGARVAVTLEGAPYGDAVDAGRAAFENEETAAALRRHGVTVQLTGPRDLPLHMKAAVVDRAAYLDDRNWPSSGSDTLVSTTDATDVAAVRSALAGTPASTADLATEKSRALGMEAETIYEAPGDRVDVESESFGTSVVSAALRDRAAAGAHVRLIVARREFAHANSVERSSLARLAAAGVEIRLASGAEKLCVAGDRAWVGSANATYASAVEPVLDWGMRIVAPSAVRDLEAAFARSWATASPPCAGGLTNRLGVMPGTALVPSRSYAR